MGIFSNIKDKISRYIEIRIDLMKVSVIGRTASVVSYVLFALICLLILFCIVLFIGLGLTNAFIDMGISAVGSFFMTTGIYILLLVFIILLRRPISRFFADSLVEVITADDNNGNEDASKNEEN
jgi:hypothetical protein